MSSKSKSQSTPVQVEKSLSLHLYGLEVSFESVTVFDALTQDATVDITIDDVEDPVSTLRITRIVVDGSERGGGNILCSDAFLEAVQECIKDTLNNVRLAI